MFSSADLSLAAVKMRKNELFTGGFLYDLPESQVASWKHFQCQNSRFRGFEAGYWKGFQNKSNFKEKAITKQQKIVKTISACTESTFFIIINL